MTRFDERVRLVSFLQTATGQSHDLPTIKVEADKLETVLHQNSILMRSPQGRDEIKKTQMFKLPKSMLQRSDPEEIYLGLLSITKTLKWAEESQVSSSPGVAECLPALHSLYNLAVSNYNKLTRDTVTVSVPSRLRLYLANLGHHLNPNNGSSSARLTGLLDRNVRRTLVIKSVGAAHCGGPLP